MMDFTNTFNINAPLPLVWTFMQDAEEVAPCVPGASLTETIDQTHYKGTVKVKLGAVQMNYRGEMAMEPNDETHVLLLRAKGTEARGSGGASGTFTITLTPSDDGTHVEIQSKIDVTGRVAQFGRGIMQDVGNRLIKEFANCLEHKLQIRANEQDSGPGEPGAGAATSSDTSDGNADQAHVAQADPARDEVVSRTTTPPARAYAPAASTYEAKELRLGTLLVELGRSRLAAGLRALAVLVEPK